VFRVNKCFHVNKCFRVNKLFLFSYVKRPHLNVCMYVSLSNMLYCLSVCMLYVTRPGRGQEYTTCMFPNSVLLPDSIRTNLNYKV